MRKNLALLLRTIPSLILFIVILITGCYQDNNENENAGSLSISISSILNNSGPQFSILPTVDTVPTSYMVTGNGPENTTFSQAATENSITVNELALGEWTIVISALNANNLVIAQGSGSATVSNGETTSIAITVSPQEGTGDFSITVSWPTGSVQKPSIDSKLIPNIGDAIPLSFTILPNSNSATAILENIKTGYYTLTIKLLDNNLASIGKTETVRIVKDQSTTGTVQFLSINKGSGSINTSATVDMKEPLDVTITGIQQQINKGSEMTVQANVNTTVMTMCKWYLNGDFVAEGTSVTFGKTLKPGNYNLDLVVTTADLSRSGSTTAFFIVNDIPVLRKLVVSAKVNNKYDIFSLNEDGSGLTNLSKQGVFVKEPKISPDGSKIVFVMNSKIYIMNADGSNLFKLSRDITASDINYDPQWSPDGSKVLFSSLGNGICIVSADGKNQVVYSGGAEDPRWSPDSSKILFNDLYILKIINADGTGLINLATKDMNNDPQWSPDGSKILFTANRDSNWEIYCMNADGTNQQNLTKNSANVDMMHKWSPDGTKIVFVSGTESMNYDINIMDSDGGNKKILIKSLARDEDPCWSPDGKKIAFEGYFGLCVINADGTGKKIILESPNIIEGIDWFK